jgi:mannosyltransferase OCH1-like enzyme
MNKDMKKIAAVFFIIVIIVLLCVLVMFRKQLSEMFLQKDISETYSVMSFYKPITNLSYDQKIPLKIHQTYFNNDMNIQYYETCMINRYMNIEYEYHFYNNDDVNEYIRTYYPQYVKLFDRILPGAYKADLFRYLVIYREGGVYLDCKSSTIIPLREFIPKNVGFVCFRDLPVGCIQISFIASVPGHPLLGKSIEIAFHNIKNKLYGTTSLDITGPRVCGRAFNQLLKNERPGIEQKEDIMFGYYSEIDVLVIGEMIVDSDGYEYLIDHKRLPLISRACCLYYKGSRFGDKTHYNNAWNSRKNVYKDD